MPSTSSATASTARDIRIKAITDGACVREALGQVAIFRFDGGRFIIIHQGRAFSGSTLDEAIAAAQRAGGPA